MIVKLYFSKSRFFKFFKKIDLYVLPIMKRHKYLREYRRICDEPGVSLRNKILESIRTRRCRGFEGVDALESWGLAGDDWEGTFSYPKCCEEVLELVLINYRLKK